MQAPVSLRFRVFFCMSLPCRFAFSLAYVGRLLHTLRVITPESPVKYAKERVMVQKVSEFEFFFPSGQYIFNREYDGNASANRDACSSLPMLERAQASGAILEGTALLCDSELNLHIDFPALPGVRGIIPREEAVYTRPGEPVKDIAILTRVGKAVCFKVQGIDTPDAEGLTTVRLSRRAAQAECAAVYIADLAPGDVVRGRVTHLESFGAFVDIG